jgi:hypothetical protein
MGAPSNSAHLIVLAMVSLLPACATAPLVQGSRLSSYEGMTPSNGWIAKSRVHVKKEQVLAAKTINIQSTAFPPTVAPTLSNQQRDLVANAVDRALCVTLSDRFRVVRPDEPADLTVRASITHAKETNKVAAGVSVAASIGMNFVDTAVPIPISRVPIGLGNLSIEAEAIDARGQQQASMLWGKGATAFFSSPRVSKASDAYDLAAEFGDDFGDLLVKGQSPFDKAGIGLPSWRKFVPSWHKIKSSMGLAPKYAACESYGRSPGIVGKLGNKIGLPPEWTDRGARQAAQ